VSRNFFWVPGTLTTFDWEKSDYTHTPAVRHEDLTALANLPPAQLDSQAEVESTANGREVRVRLTNRSQVLAFQVRAAVRTASGDLIAPVLWSDNWIEVIPGESVTLTAALPDSATAEPVVQVDGWNVAPVTLTPRSIANKSAK
jgi:exo-1,4-beta-D-glucosaminidase